MLAHVFELTSGLVACARREPERDRAEPVALPHGEQHRIELTRGEVMLIDTGGSFHGYQSVNTRSWVFDATPTEHQAGVWNAVHGAQQAAFEAIRPGALAGDVDRAAREFLERGGWTEGYSKFTHRLGHGIGMEGHEAPYFDGGSEVVLAERMTFSDEPGIYLRGEFGSASKMSSR